MSGKNLCGFDSGHPVPQVPWPNGATGFALWMISYVCCALCLSAAELSSFQVFLLVFLIWQGWELHSALDCAMTVPLSGVGWGGVGGWTRVQHRQGSSFEDPNLAELCSA